MVGNPLRTLGAAALYAQLGRLIESSPQLLQAIPGIESASVPLGPAETTWMGRAEALVYEALGASGKIEFDHIRQKFENHRRARCPSFAGKHSL
jgi:hypothetical protein